MNLIMSIVERIRALASIKGITIAEFERKANLANGYIGKVKGSIGSEKIEDILSAFPDLSVEWLMRGEGAMLRPIVIADNGSIAAAGDVSGGQTGGGDRSLAEKVKALETENAYLRGQVDLLMQLVKG